MHARSRRIGGARDDALVDHRNGSEDGEGHSQAGHRLGSVGTAVDRQHLDVHARYPKGST